MLAIHQVAVSVCVTLLHLSCALIVGRPHTRFFSLLYFCCVVIENFLTQNIYAHPLPTPRQHECRQIDCTPSEQRQPYDIIMYLQQCFFFITFSDATSLRVAAKRRVLRGTFYSISDVRFWLNQNSPSLHTLQTVPNTTVVRCLNFIHRTQWTEIFLLLLFLLLLKLTKYSFVCSHKNQWIYAIRYGGNSIGPPYPLFDLAIFFSLDIPRF